MRRVAPTVAVLFVGLLLLLWGLATLEGIIVEERHDAKAQLDDARETLAQYARRALQGELAAALHEVQPQIAEAANDPLAADEGLLLIDESAQVLPRWVRFAPGDSTPGRELYSGLRTGDTDDIEASLSQDPEGPWAQRLALHEAVQRALRSGSNAAIEHAVRALLLHRALWVLQTVNELPATLAMLDALYEHSTPLDSFVAQLLKTGMGRRGLQRQLLSRRERFTEPDFRFLAERIVSLSTKAGVPSDDFELQVAAAGSERIFVPESTSGPSLLSDGHWYIEPRHVTQFVGVAVDLAPHFAAVEQEMRDRGLLREADAIAVVDRTGLLAELEVKITAPRLDAAAQDADRRFSLKTTFVVLAATLALIIAVLAVVLQHKSSRFVELKSDFVATVSHELRTPLASIRLMAETLQRRTIGVPRVRDYPERIVREIDELAFLVENILSFNRLDKGRWEPRPSHVDVAEVMDDVVASLEHYGFSDVELTTEGIDGLTLNADRELLKLMFRNLTKNACTYNDRTPIEISVRLRPDSRNLTLEFTDNGVGIDPAQHKRVFQDFRRGGQSRARGSGLGLSICRKSAAAHGGRISITKSGPEGTTFEVALPRALVISAGE